MSGTVGKIGLGKRHPKYPKERYRDGLGGAIVPRYGWPPYPPYPPAYLQGAGGSHAQYLGKRHPKYPKDRTRKGMGAGWADMTPQEWSQWGLTTAEGAWNLYRQITGDVPYVQEGPTIQTQPYQGPVATPLRDNTALIVGGVALGGLLLWGLTRR